MGRALYEDDKQAVLAELRREFELAGANPPDFDEPWWKLW